MLTYVNGDIFDYIETNKLKCLVPHVVNCKGAFGAGFAYAIAKKYPYVKAEYAEWLNRYDVPKEALGQVELSATNTIVFAHMCAQTLGGDRPLYYNHLASCMTKVARHAQILNRDIITVPFGSGLAGGNFEFIKELIHDCWVREGINVTIVDFKKNPAGE